AEVGKTHDRFAAYPQHHAENPDGVVDGLQRQAHDDVVEEAVLEAGQPFFQVYLDHVDAVGNARGDVGRIIFHAPAAHLAHLCEMGEQAAVTATQIEHGCAR